ncbi:MAG: ester cyclase [Nitrosopumilus sp.]|nr:ester cyclase [Nitrosopumilus sp.]
MQIYDQKVDTQRFPGVTPGIESLKNFYQAFWSAFPGSQLSIEDIVKENNKIVSRYSISGNHKGTLMGIPPSNKDVKFGGITILQFNDDNKCIKR